MIARLICALTSHKPRGQIYYKTIVKEGKMKVVIPMTNYCDRCGKELRRKLQEYEIQSLIHEYSILE